MGQKRLALHEKQGKRRKANIGHRVVYIRVRAAPCIGKDRANSAQPRQKRLQYLHTSTKHSLTQPRIPIGVPPPFRTAGVSQMPWNLAYTPRILGARGVY